MDPNLAVFIAAAMLFVALATLILGLFAWLRADLRRLEARMAAMEHGQAKLEGLLVGLREAISGRVHRAAAE